MGMSKESIHLSHVGCCQIDAIRPRKTLRTSYDNATIAELLECQTYLRSLTIMILQPALAEMGGYLIADFLAKCALCAFVGIFDDDKLL
jgi:hypothetical protein